MLGCTAPDFAKKFILQTDACNDGVGGVLFQEEAGVKHAVALASKKLLAREKKLLNNWKGVFSYCLGCTEVSKLSVWEAICIRNRPLQYLGKAQFQNGRLMRWALPLQPYRFTIKAIKGSENIGADFLIRHVAE